MRAGRLRQLVSLQNRPTVTNDADGFWDDLDPRTVFAAIEPLTPSGDGRNITHAVTMRYHPQVSVDTRIQFTDFRKSQVRELMVLGVQNVEERNAELELLCVEVFPVSVKVQLIGFDEFRRYLQDLPEHLVGEATAIVTRAAQLAADETRSNYPTGPTGNLKSRVTVNTEVTRSSAFARVSSRAPHAWIFEYGTGNRRTDKGWARGRMGTPGDRGRPEQAMVPHVIRARARMFQDLVAMVERQGFQVAA